MPSKIVNALTDLLNDHDSPLEELVKRHFSPKYRQRTNGQWDDIGGFFAHITHLREMINHAEVTLLNELVVAQNYSSRHIVNLEKVDGTSVTQEVYLFGELSPDGRFETVEEVTMMLSGAEADRSIGNAR